MSFPQKESLIYFEMRAALQKTDIEEMYVNQATLETARTHIQKLRKFYANTLDYYNRFGQNITGSKEDLKTAMEKKIWSSKVEMFIPFEVDTDDILV